MNAPHNQPSRFAMIERYWADPSYRRDLEQERAVEQAKINAAFDAHRDAGLRKAGLL